MGKAWDWIKGVADRQPTTGDEKAYYDAGQLYTDALKKREREAAQAATAAAAAQSGNANSSSLQGTIDPDRAGAGKGPIDPAAAAAGYGAGVGLLAGKKKTAETKTDAADTSLESPTTGGGIGGGTNGGNRVTYIDAAGEPQKGTADTGTEAETTTEPQRTYLDDLKDQYQKMYDDAIAANDAAAKAAAERAREQVDASIGSLGDSYGNLNRQLYRDYMESLRLLPQELAAKGYSGGMSESARLGLDTAYGERLNENEAARIAAIADLNQQAADAEYQTNAARDQANAEAQQNLYANFMNLLLQKQNDDAQKAQNMAQYGDFSGYKNLGYTQEEIDAMQKAWIAANPELAKTLGYVETPTYSGYYSGGSGSKTTAGMKGASDGLKKTIEAALDGGEDRVQIWNDLAGQYRAGNISEEEFNDAIHYTDYAATSKAYGQGVTETGYAKWPGGYGK